MTDYIPKKDADFDIWFKNLVQYVNQKCIAVPPATEPEWDHIPASRRNELNNSYADWYTAYVITLKPHTPPETEAKNEARDDSEAEIRPFVNQYLRFPPVTNVDRTAMGIHNRDPHPTPVPKPTAQVEADLTFPGIHLVELKKIRPIASGAPPDPRSDYGVRIYYGILDGSGRERITAPPLTGDDLPHSVFTRRKKYRFDFDGSSGKTVYLCMRYENDKGGEEGEGPFGPILSAVIP
ncbi:MAG: hypothetical protein LBQ44_05040 [Treponema sp.]|jgi:hypothetical protein|nr:hypothetical protein [Treponema sp.]